MIKCDSSNTQIFFSKIFHKRLRPKIHEFRYNNLYVSVPIRSYSRTENKGNVFFGLNRCSFLTVNDIDHGDGKPLIEWIENILLNFKLKVDGEIWLSTFPKVLRLGFKPVSFWFCENKKNQIVAVVVEVNNTFKQREIYVLSPKDCNLIYHIYETHVLLSMCLYYLFLIKLIHQYKEMDHYMKQYCLLTFF